MKVVLATHTLDIPENVKLEIKGKQICVTGPSGVELKRNFKHRNLDFHQIEDGKKLKIDAWFGYRKTIAASRIAINDVNKLIARVTEANPDDDLPCLAQLEDSTMAESGKPDVDCPSLEDSTTTEIESLWYEALFEENCVRVMQLLKDHPRLLRVGWKKDPAREVEGRPVNHRSPRVRRSWMGRTALHVGAIRGSTELILQVLDMCGRVNMSPVLSWLNGQGAGTAARTDEALAQDHQEAGSPVAPWNCWVDGTKQETAKRVVESNGPTGRLQNRGTFAHLKRKLSMGKERSLQEITEVSPVASESRKPQFEPLCVEFDENHNPDRTNGEIFSEKEYEELVMSKDGEYDLKAVDVASFHGITDASALLHYASRLHGMKIDSDHYILDTIGRFSGGDNTERARLREATAGVIESFSKDPAFRRDCLHEYSKDRDFNFLPREEYLFHFLFTTNLSVQGQRRLFKNVRKALWTKVRSFPNNLWRFLLELKDGQGRPPCHIAITTFSMFEQFYSLIQDGRDDVTEVVTCALTTLDGAGRTPVFTSAAGSSSYCSNNQILDMILCKTDALDSTFDKVFATFFSACSYPQLLQEGWRKSDHSIPMLRNFRCTPLQAAILNRRSNVVGALLEAMKLWNKRRLKLMWEETFYRFHWYEIRTDSEVGPPEFPGHELEGHLFNVGNRIFVELSDLELAVLVKEKRSVEFLLKAGYPRRARKFSEDEILDGDKRKKIGKLLKHPWHALHIAAASGSYEWLKMFIDNHQCNPFVEDFQGNSALQHAMHVDSFQYGVNHMLNYLTCMSCRQYHASKENCASISKRENKELVNSDLIQVQGCINLLLQAGCDVFKTNKAKQAPYPLGCLSENVDFLSWWYERQAKELKAIQNSLIVAANAISVTGTLVATASYVGPLQPPLGYASDPINQIQYENGWVATFVFCDTLSFYLAVVAIIFSLVPSLPMPEQAMMDELRRTRTMVTLAVGVLFPSIISVLIAFASSSMAVVSANLTSSIGGGLSIATFSICGPLFLLAFSIFLTRLMANVFPRHAWVRYMYQLTYF